MVKNWSQICNHFICIVFRKTLCEGSYFPNPKYNVEMLSSIAQSWGNDDFTVDKQWNYFPLATKPRDPVHSLKSEFSHLSFLLWQE